MNKFNHKVVLTVIAVFLMALFARLTLQLPLNELKIPVTGQSFAILLLAFLLGKKWGSIAIGLYLTLGAMGLPVFADGAGGIAVFEKASAGFLIGFLPAGFLAGYFGDIGWGNSFPKCLVAMLLSTALLLFLGVAYLSMKIGLDKALNFGLYPFIPGAILKIILSATVAFLFYKKTAYVKF